MSGHSKWSTIKHKKGAADARKGKVFTKIIKELTIAARFGGGDPNANSRLRKAVNEAKANNMPSDNVERAIKRGTGELEGVNYEEATYEGYGPGGAAVLLEVITDNKNRTVSEIRRIFSKGNGNLGEPGCVAWMFESRGVVNVPSRGVDEDAIIEAALESGALDVENMGDFFEVRTEPENVDGVAGFLKEKGFNIESSKVSRVPKNYVKLDDRSAEQMLKLMDSLEDHDDVKNVFANFDIDDSVIEKFS